MNKILRTILFMVTGIAVLAIGLVMVAVSTLQPKRLSRELEQAVEHATGRAFSAPGGVKVEIGLSPHVVMQDVSLANIAGASRPQMITAPSLSADLAFLPLLTGQIVVSSVTLQNPDVVLERAADGTPNWQFTPVRKPAMQGETPAIAAPVRSASENRHRIEIKAITLQGGQLTWLPASGQPAILSIGTLVIAAKALDTPMTMTLNGALNGAKLTLTARGGSLGRLQGGPVSALAGTWPINIDATMGSATLHVEGGINHPDQLRAYQVRVTGHAANLADLQPLVHFGGLPPMADVNGTAFVSDGTEGELLTSQVSLHTGASDLSAWVPGLLVKDAVLSAPGPGQLAQLNVTGTYQSQPLNVSLTAVQPERLNIGGPLRVSLSAQAAGATLSAHGTMPPGLHAIGLDMAVNLRANDLAALSPLLGVRLPPAQNLSLSAQLGDAGMKLNGFALRDLISTSSLGDLAGDVTFNWAPRPAVAGSLSAHTLNLDALFAPSAPAASPLTLPGVTAAVAPSLPVPAKAPGEFKLAALRAVDADITLAADDVVFGGQHYRALDTHVQLQGGKLAINPFRAQAPEGAINGGLSLDASEDVPPVAISLRSPSLSAGAIAELAGFPGGASGTMQVDAQLSGTGQSVSAIEATLAGHLGLAMVNGQVDNAMIESLVGDALHTAGVGSLGGGSSQVRCFAMRMDFAAGLGSLRALALDTSHLVMDGDGWIDLRGSEVDLHLRPQVRIGNADVTAPVSLKGPFGHLKAALDKVMGGGRVGFSLNGGAPASDCPGKLALARNGLAGPAPAAPPPAVPLKIRKPKDLLKGLFH